MWNSGSTQIILSVAGLGNALRVAPQLVDRARRAEIGVREHGALGLAGGAAGVLQERDVLHADLGPLPRQLLGAVLAQLLEPDEARRVRDRRGRDGRGAEGRVVSDDQVIDQAIALELARQQRHEADVGGDENAGAGVPQLEGQLALGVERGEVHDAPAGLERAEEREGVDRRVGQVESNRLARADAEVHQAGGDGLHAGAQLGIAGLPVAVFERRLGRPLLRESDRTAPAASPSRSAHPSARRPDSSSPRGAALPLPFLPCCWRPSCGTMISANLGADRDLGNKLTYRTGRQRSAP